jgi:hypothetical protein
MNLPVNKQLIIGFILATILILTRSYHFGDLHHLPEASWAVFFLAGVYIQSRWGLAAFFSITFLLDFSAYWSGAYASCFTPAYAMLLPAYASLWMAGRWYAKQYNLNFNSLVLLAGAVVVGTFSCELFSSGGYYLFSGKFEPSLAEFASRVVQYYPSYLASTAFYVTLAALIHAMIAGVQRHNNVAIKT